jgi:2-polyprenyl-3-methyl-5-hydroxy-6-metoxy-1,4-benzoquinol methylase
MATKNLTVENKPQNNDEPVSPQMDFSSSPQECIELLPVSLLDENRSLVEELKALSVSLGLEFGWHYLLDLTWIIKHLGSFFPVEKLAGKRIIDAGAGTGMIQWYLAEHGAEVISIDRTSRAFLPIRFRKRYRVKGLRPRDLETTTRLIQMDLMGHSSSPDVEQNRAMKKARTRLSHLGNNMVDMVVPKQVHKTFTSTGSVIIYNQDLANLEDIPDNSIDAVVSTSALEHNTPEGLEKVVRELLRVIKPGAPMMATLTAAQYQDTWHEPSSGWLYIVRSLARHFDLPEGAIMNEQDYDPLFKELCNCVELRDHLARFYYQSGKNGMPWGKWDPQYMPVGVLKIKQPSHGISG